MGADGNKLLTSEDGGLNWTTRSIPTSHGRLIAVNANTFYLLASDVYISSDGGDSWVNTGSLGYNRQATGVAISSANYAYLAMRDGPVQKSASPVIPPDPPSNLTIAGYSATLVSLKWDDNANNEQYHIIERSDGNNTSYDSVGYVNANSQSQIIGGFIVPNDNTLYYFRVRAVGPGGYSAYSNEVSVTTPLHCEVYTIPYNRSWTATTLDESGVGVFTNNEVPIIGANGSYQVRDLTVGATIGVTPPISEPVFVSFREDCGNVHMTSVFPLYANGNGTWDAGTETLTIHWQTRPGYTPRAETTVFTLNEVDPAPPAPLNLGAYIKTTEEIVVTWSGSNFAQQYQVQRSLTSGSGFVNVGEAISATSRLLFIDTETFSIGTTYYYRIVASSFGGGSTASDEIAVTVQTPLFEAISLPDFDYSSQGVAWVDIEGDGDDDLLVTPINVPSGSIAVFENNGDGTFDNIPVPGISDHEGFISLSSTTLRTISAGDVNNDGFMDFLALGPSTGGGIWINQSGTGFEYIELLPPDNSGQGWYAQLVDINNDGRLDAVVSQYSTPGTTATTHMRIFVQNPEGDFGLYELGEIAADATHSYGGNWADYDNDGDQDFFRSQYTNEADRLYRNNGDGTFSRLTGTAFETDGTLGSRSVSWGDFDNDLDLDVYVVNTRSLQYSMLYQNNGDGTFSRLPDNLLSQPQTVLGVGSAWGDVDNDGDLDMVLGNNQQSHLYLNDGAGNFSRQTGAEYLLAYDVSRANIAFALSDYDQNGSLDIAAGKNLFEFPSILLRNNLLPDANTQWLEVKLQGTASNRSGIGAHITIETPDGRRQMRAITSLTGYGSAGSLVAHFGLKDQSTVETLQVFWPSGATQTLTNISSNQILEIIEDGVGPKPAALYPLHEATAVRTGTFLEITLDESSIPVAGKFGSKKCL